MKSGPISVERSPAIPFHFWWIRKLYSLPLKSDWRVWLHSKTCAFLQHFLEPSGHSLLFVTFLDHFWNFDLFLFYLSLSEKKSLLVPAWMVKVRSFGLGRPQMSGWIFRQKPILKNRLSKRPNRSSRTPVYEIIFLKYFSTAFWISARSWQTMTFCFRRNGPVSVFGHQKQNKAKHQNQKPSVHIKHSDE